METIHTAEATAKGIQKSHVQTKDEMISLDIVIPEGKIFGNENASPESLFAAAYASCFLSALRVVAFRENITLGKDSSVDAKVSLVKDKDNYKLEVELNVLMDSLSGTEFDKVIEKAKEIFPFSTEGSKNLSISLNKGTRRSG